MPIIMSIANSPVQIEPKKKPVQVMLKSEIVPY